jgi:hypothetical protein
MMSTLEPSAGAAPPATAVPLAPTVHPTRPGPVHWLWYALGGSLPARYDEWVYLDTTSRTWLLRHLSHALVQLGPVVAAALIFIPGPFWIRTVAVVAASAMALLFAFAYLIETTDHRLTKAGYPSGLAETVRRDRSRIARRDGIARRRAATAARQAQRRSARG